MYTILKNEENNDRTFHKDNIFNLYYNQSERQFKSPIFTLNQNNKKNETLNKDIVHLIKTENKNQEIIQEDNKCFQEENNNPISILPSIKLNSNKSSSSLISFKSNNHKSNITKNNSIPIRNYKYKDDLLNNEEKIVNKKYNNTLVDNIKINIPNIKLNNKKIKNDNNILNTSHIKTSEEKKNNIIKKVKIVSTKEILPKKNNNIRNNTFNYFNFLFINSKTNPILMASYSKNNSSMDIINNIKEIKKNNDYIKDKNLHKNNSTKNLSKLDELYYLNIKLKDTKKQIEKRIKALKNEKTRKFLNRSSIKKDIFNYNDLFSKIKRINVLENIKQKKKIMKDFQKSTYINLRNEEKSEIVDKDKILMKNIIELIKENNKKKLMSFKENNKFKNKSTIIKNNLQKKDNNNNQFFGNYFNDNDKNRNNYYKNSKSKLDILLKKEHIELYNL